MVNSINVFVYGSLMRGYHNHSLLEVHDAEFVDQARTVAPAFSMISLGSFPGVVDGGRCYIDGELYRVNDECFEALDSLEGHPTFYKRRMVTVKTDMGRHMGAWMYILQQDVWPTHPRVVQSWNGMNQVYHELIIEGDDNA